MSNILTKNFKSQNVYLFILCLTPISFVTGSLMANVFTVFLFLICLAYGQKKIFVDFFKKYKNIIIVFLLISSLNIIYSETFFYSLTKLTSFFRFFIFSLSIIVILDLSLKNIPIYSKIYLGFIIFLVLDSYIQLFVGYDIFGFPYNYDYARLTGPFKDEMIIGNYLLYFGFLSIALINYFYKLNNFYNFFLFFLISITVLISGERTPFISLIYFFSILFIFSSKKKFIFLTSCLIFFISFVVINYSDRLSEKYKITSMLLKIADIESKTVRPKASENSTSQKFIKQDLNFSSELSNLIKSNQYTGHYSRAIEIFQSNYIFGTGFKSYRKICGSYETLKQPNQYGTDENRRLTCSIHPHNYHLEILADTGLTGYLAFLFFIIYIFFIFFKKSLYKNFPSCILFTLIITYIFPFKPSGSFFSTNSAFIFWFIIGHFFYFSKLIDYDSDPLKKF